MPPQREMISLRRRTSFKLRAKLTADRSARSEKLKLPTASASILFPRQWKEHENTNVCLNSFGCTRHERFPAESSDMDRKEDNTRCTAVVCCLPVLPCQCLPLETFLAFSSWKEVVKGRKQHFCYVLLHHAASQHLPFYSNTGTICLTLVSLSLCFWVPRSNANPYKFSLSAHPSHPIPSQVTTLGLSCQYHYSTSSLSKAKATRLTLSSSHKFLVHHLLQRWWHWQEILYRSRGEPETSLTAVSGFVLNETLDHKVSNL